MADFCPAGGYLTANFPRAQSAAQFRIAQVRVAPVGLDRPTDKLEVVASFYPDALCLRLWLISKTTRADQRQSAGLPIQ
jgi:hypothetical protein